ncbi:MAG: type 4a pilus biogenesis protein PilO [Candidatus Nealsonbacteria bacterium]
MIQNKNISLIILGVIAVLLAGFVVRPLFLSIKQNSEAFFIQKGILAELEKKSENFKKFQSTYEIYQANLKRIDRLFVDNKEPVEFIEFLEEEAARVKLTIDLMPFTSKAGEVEDVWPSMSFQVNMAGSFTNFLRFLDKIESSPHLIVLSGLSLNKPTKNTNGDIAISFQMKVYTR